MSEFVFLGAQVRSRMAAGARPAGNAFNDANTRALQLIHFIGIIGEEANGADAERLERFGGELVVAGVIGKTEAAIGFHGVEARILELVCLEFVDQADSAAFLRQIKQYAGRLLGDLAQRKFQLGAAIATL